MDGFAWALLLALIVFLVIWLILSIDHAIHLWRGQIEDDE